MAQGSNIQGSNTPRYPELSPDITMDELVKKWSELVRLLNDRDRQPILPSQVYGRTIQVGGANFQDLTFVTAGASVSGVPFPGFWHIYEYNIPRDGGFILVETVSVSANANVQIRTNLPLAASVRDRTITVVGANTGNVTLAAFNLGVFPTSGSGDTLVPILGGSVTVVNSTTLAGSLAVSASPIDIGGNKMPPNRRLMAYTGSQVFDVVPVSVSGSTATIKGPAMSTGIYSELSGTISSSVSSTATLNPALNFTFKAYGNKWIQVS